VQTAAPAAHVNPLNKTALGHQTTARFSELALHPNSQRALAEVMQYALMTEVQHKAIPVCLAGGDVVARAKTGTGKTLGFCLPAIETMIKKGCVRGGCSVLILSPTRELAMQSATEAEKLSTFHGFGVQTIYGGTSIQKEKRRLFGAAAQRCDILVATPGRLIDHLENTPGGAQLFANLRVLVLDEADQLLEMGFQPAMKKIAGLLPSKETRQTLLFSATMPPKVRQFVPLVARTTNTYVDCVGDQEEQTHTHVKQEMLVVDGQDQIKAMLQILLIKMTEPEYVKEAAAAAVIILRGSSSLGLLVLFRLSYYSSPTTN